MKEESQLRIGNNVYWISSSVAARHRQGGSQGRHGWFRFALSLPCERRDEPALAKLVADELEAILQTRPHYAIGLALASGALTASLLHFM